jgi:hypothetical protein
MHHHSIIGSSTQNQNSASVLARCATTKATHLTPPLRAKRQPFRTQSPYPDVGVAQHPHIARVVWDDERD